MGSKVKLPRVSRNVVLNVCRCILCDVYKVYAERRLAMHVKLKNK